MFRIEKKWTVRGLIVAIIVSWIFIGLKIYQHNQQPIRYKWEYSTKFTNVYNGKPLVISNYDSDKCLLLIYFNTQCDFCQFELKELEKSVSKFENTEIVLISAEPLDTLRKFGQKYQFHLYPNAGFYHCCYDTLQKHFGKLISPTTFIYGTDGKLIRQFNGTTRIDEMLKVIRQLPLKKDSLSLNCP